MVVDLLQVEQEIHLQQVLHKEIQEVEEHLLDHNLVVVEEVEQVQLEQWFQDAVPPMEE
jgi:hypothetical protein